jgi:hypothetical protein
MSGAHAFTCGNGNNRTIQPLNNRTLLTGAFPAKKPEETYFNLSSKQLSFVAAFIVIAAVYLKG